MNELTVIVNNEEVKVNRGITLEELSKSYQDNFKYEIIIAKVDGIYKELTETISKNCTIEFFDLTNRGANQVYLNGLIFLTICAFKRLFGSSNDIKVNHSLDKGLFIEPSIELQEDDIEKLRLEIIDKLKKNSNKININIKKKKNKKEKNIKKYKKNKKK